MRFFVLSLFLLIASSPGANAQNLVINGDAEAGPGGNGTTIVPPPDWNLTGEFTSVYWSNGSGWMGPSDPGPPNRGSNYFAGGRTAVSEAVQTIDLSAHASLIDRDLVDFTLSGWLGGWDSQNDNAQVLVWFTNEFGGLTGFEDIGPVFASDRNNITGLLYREFVGRVPPDTRNADITITLTRTDQSYNDGYADNVSLVLDLPSPPTLSGPPTVQAGGTLSLSVQDGIPGATLWTAYSLAGGGPTPSPFGPLALSPPIKRATTYTLDSQGSKQIAANIPAGAIGQTIWIQVLDRGSDLLSNGISVDVN